MIRKSDLSRREFLKDTAVGAAGAAVLGGLTPARVLGANDRIRVGVLGSGGRAQYVMGLFKKFPAIQFVAVCDVYGPHREEALKIAGPDAKGYVDYREVLGRKDVDAVLIGSPDHWHKQMLVDSVRAGKDVYLEKPIMHSIEEGGEMVRAVEETKRVVQTGHAATKLGTLHSRQAHRGLREARQNHLRPHLLVPELPRVDRANLPRSTLPNWIGNDGWEVRRISRLTPRSFASGGTTGILAAASLADLLTHWIDVIQWYMAQPAPKTATTTAPDLPLQVGRA